MRRDRKAWLHFLATRLGGLFVDSAVLGAAYLGAFILRFDFREPSWGWRAVALSYATVCAVHLLLLIACGCYRMAWRRMRMVDLPRFALATALACAALTVLRYQMPSVSLAHIRPPYSITLISFFLGTLGVIGWRLAWRWYARAIVRENALLGRDCRRMDSAAAVGFLRGKTVMVTGAGGTIGSELVRQIVPASPKLVLLVERCEQALYEIDRELRETGVTVATKPLLADVTDGVRMEELFAGHRPEIVLHAAAYKHVPMVEMNPREGERNNAGGTRTVAELAKRHGTARFVLISTDKAVNPVSAMGRSKREAEKVVMSLNDRGQSPTSYCAVRFGNVLGSSGSVVPLFREQIERRRPVTVTHPDMKRYFMTVQEAVGLVLQAASRRERAIYTLDMGEPVRILDLAEDMIRLAGYKPYVDIPIQFTGMRPGEKLFEELDVSEKSACKTDMPRIYVTKVEE